jgi:hypothetical protein
VAAIEDGVGARPGDEQVAVLGDPAAGGEPSG